VTDYEITPDHTTIQVLLCASNPITRAGLRNALQGHRDIRILDKSGDIADVIIRGRPPGADVAVVQADQRVLKYLRSATTCGNVPVTYPVVVVTGRIFEHTILGAIGGGIRGFVSDRAAESELVVAVRSVAVGCAFLSPGIAEGLLDWLAGQLPADPTRFTRAAHMLTGREREVLEQLGQGSSNAQIAKELVISQTTVRSHVYNILTKLGLPNRTQAALFGYQYKLMNTAAA
jgi:DNA-binding NarL/FixJ family response regulator